MTPGLVDVGAVMRGLKDFQRATVEHTFERLFLAEDSTHRFLVADEVGLGKTMVARGVVAKAIDHLQREGVEKIDVIYICSNAEIARQNVARLAVTRDESACQTLRALVGYDLGSRAPAHGREVVSGGSVGVPALAG